MRDDDYPGFCRVVLNEHVGEMTDLDITDRQRLMDIVFLVEQTIRDTVRPDKINLASLGNRVPHLHWHVIPRWRDDATFPDAIWVPVRRKTHRNGYDSGELKRRIQSRLEALLSDHLGKAPPSQTEKR